MKGLALLTFVFLSTCSFNGDTSEDVVARVGNDFLTRAELSYQIGAQYSYADSALIASNYINEWAKQKLLLEKAVFNLSEQEQSTLDALVQAYRSDLYIKSYIEKVVQSQIDTLLTDSLIEQYYTLNRQNFKTNRDLIKGRYIRVRKENYNLRTIKRSFNRFNSYDESLLDSIALQFTTYSLNDSMWIQADQFFEKILPLKNNSKKNYLKKNKNFELEDSLEVYLIAVNETINRNEIAPLSYVRPTLKQILINKRKLELMQQFDQAVFEEAAQKNIFEVYE
jgi:hypothetical protein